MPEREKLQPEDILFDANLQEFANKVSLICGLESNGKLSTSDAYDQIKSLWKQLRRSKKGLRIGKPYPDQESPEATEDD